MRVSASTATLILALATSIIATACGESDVSGPTATVSGVVSAATGTRTWCSTTTTRGRQTPAWRGAST